MLDLNEFRRQKKQLEEQIAAHGEAAITQGFKEFFEKFPEIAAVRWNQYTPHFNDGDACTFGMNGFELSLDFVGSLKEDSEYEDDEWIEYWSAKSRTGNIAKAFEFLDNTFDDLDDVFESAFGDGFEITATRDGFHTVQYDHD